MEEHQGMTITASVILALLLGGGVGYYVGLNRAVALQEEDIASEIAERANPFAAEEAEYVNPFSAEINPFAQ